jgi:hypothetical protein
MVLVFVTTMVVTVEFDVADSNEAMMRIGIAQISLKNVENRSSLSG